MADRKISIIVPVYRTEKYLERCVDSLLNQTYRETEIVLVDDGSPDECPGMCDGYGELDERIRVVHKENGGLVSAWQAGVKASTGEYLCFVDSDDWVERDMLEKMAAYLSPGENAFTGKNPSTEGNLSFRKNLSLRKEDKKEIICCNFVINRPGKETEHFHGLEPGIYEGERLQGEIKENLLGHENRKISMSRCMKLFSRSLIEDNIKYSNPHITMGEDVNIVLPALLDCRRVVIMEGALFYHYFYNDTSMVHKYDAGMYEGIKTLYRTIKEIYKAKGRESGKTQADKEYIYLLLLALKNEIRSGEKGYGNRVKTICGEKENREIIASSPVSIGDKTNRLLYFVLRHPWVWAIAALRLVFMVHDGVRKK